MHRFNHVMASYRFVSRKLICSIALLLGGFFTFSSCAAEQISVGLVRPVNNRTTYHQLFAKFHQETGIKVKTVVLTGKLYKERVHEWLIEGKNSPDVIYWFGSERLFDYVRQGVVHPITSLWKSSHFEQNFRMFKDVVSYQGEVYALPFFYYQWGLFYNKELIANYGKAPSTWREFLAMCEKMKQDGVIPIGIGTKRKWSSAAWFDYFNLRINGLDFYRKVLKGSISFHDLRIQKVLLAWKELIDKSYFIKHSSQTQWKEMLGHMYRNKVGFLLMADYVSNLIYKRGKEKIAFSPFPKMAEVGSYEVAPVDLFMISAHSKKKVQAEKLLKFLSRADIQSIVNQKFGHLPANQSTVVTGGQISMQALQLIKNADGVSQFFDRDTIPAFSDKAVSIFTDFIENGEIEKATNALEQARVEAFSE